VKTRERYKPLNNIKPGQASFCVYNSPLSEYAVLGFDYGYGLDFPDMLVLWEAQFGDFANGAQIIIDQYIVCSETKWGETSSIVLLLPHGYHGQGPEHSSARLERYLQACAEDNIQVANPSTPVSYFHILRRQALRKIKKPLVLMTPKGMLRDPRCTSPIGDFAAGRFEEILPDPAAPKNARRVILCSGKVYFDLADHRKAEKIDDTAIIRIEQLYPLHDKKLQAAVAATKAEKIIWCQEESANMGAWPFMEPRLRKLFARDIAYAGRDASASTATGSHAIHELEQRELINEAFSL
jgi:2-oxoglutarate dehydrogenase E1 component